MTKKNAISSKKIFSEKIFSFLLSVFLFVKQSHLLQERVRSNKLRASIHNTASLRLRLRNHVVVFRVVSD